MIHERQNPWSVNTRLCYPPTRASPWSSQRPGCLRGSGSRRSPARASWAGRSWAGAAAAPHRSRTQGQGSYCRTTAALSSASLLHRSPEERPHRSTNITKPKGPPINFIQRLIKITWESSLHFRQPGASHWTHTWFSSTWGGWWVEVLVVLEGPGGWWVEVLVVLEGPVGWGGWAISAPPLPSSGGMEHCSGQNNNNINCLSFNLIQTTNIDHILCTPCPEN